MGPFQLGEKIWMKISQRDALDALALVGRRDFVKVLIGGGALVIGNFASAGASEVANRPFRGELFAFVAPDTLDLVFAVAFPMMSNDGVPQTVRIHASSRSWTVAGIDPLSALMSARAGDRVFVGQIAGSMPSGHAPHRLVVVSTPATTFPAGGLQIWAEVSGLDGLPTRIGNPIIAEFLAQDFRIDAGLRQHPSEPRSDSVRRCAGETNSSARRFYRPAGAQPATRVHNAAEHPIVRSAPAGGLHIRCPERPTAGRCDRGYCRHRVGGCCNTGAR